MFELKQGENASTHGGGSMESLWFCLKHTWRGCQAAGTASSSWLVYDGSAWRCTTALQAPPPGVECSRCHHMPTAAC